MMMVMILENDIHLSYFIQLINHLLLPLYKYLCNKTIQQYEATYITKMYRTP